MNICLLCYSPLIERENRYTKVIVGVLPKYARMEVFGMLKKVEKK